jgi:hypothetical protein
MLFFRALFRRIEHLDRMTGHDGGYGVLVHQLRVAIAAQKHTKIIEPAHNALQLDAIDEKNREWDFVLSHVVEESILKIGCAFDRHVYSYSLFFLASAPRRWRGSNPELMPKQARWAHFRLLESQAQELSKKFF